MDSAPSLLLIDPKRLLLDMALERSADSLLWLIVRRLAASPAVALARIWLLRPGEGCATCPMQSECRDRTTCLHLVASAGNAASAASGSLERLDGDFRRFPLGVRKVGRIASTGEPLEAPDFSTMPEWIVRPHWAVAEGIHGFGGQPLIARGEVLGVLAVFSRAPLDATTLDWLRMIADHAAAALAHARAWEEIESLRQRLEQENDYFQEETRRDVRDGDMVGRSAALQRIDQQIALVAPTDSTVLILGDSGTGKELVARAVHQRSARAARPLIKVNCASIPRELFDSEFFGHTRGSFTGAVRDRVGRFELADGGTLFLDEIGEIPLDLQAKLLRVLQEGEVQRVGEERTRRVDVRVIAATNRDLRAEVAAGRFRDDLFYRLSVFPLSLPALRERLDDIPLLAAHFLAQLARRLGRPAPRLTQGHVQQLQRHAWPGNVRELQHVLERSLITSPAGRFTLDLGDPITSAATLAAPVAATEEIYHEAHRLAFDAANIRRALHATHGRIYGRDGAAALLGIKPTTLASRMKRHGIVTRTVVE